MRYVAGTATRTSPPTARPIGGHLILDDGPLSAWAVGHDAREVRHAASRDGTAEVVTAGTCPPTTEEVQAAADAAARGHWHQAARLPGSYLAIVRTGDTLRIIGDRAAAVPVHFNATRSGVSWSTSATALAALTGAAPDPVRLLAEATTWGTEPAADGWYAGTHRVPPGAALTLSPGAPPAIEQLPVPAGRSFAAAAEQLRHELPLAVGRRALTGRPLSSDLSGGVDSSTITCLAAAHTDLTAVTYVDAAMAGQDDTLYAAEIAAAYPAVTQHVVDGRVAGSRHFDRLADPAAVPATDSPALSVDMLGIFAAQLAPAVAAGSTGHLTGFGGDNVLDGFASPGDRYRSGARAAGLRDAQRLARDRRAATHPLLRATAAAGRGSYPKALARLADTVLTGSAPRALPDAADAARWCGMLPSARWLTPAGRTAVADLFGARAEAADPDVGPGALRERLALEATGAEFANSDTLTRALFGLPLHAPFLDTRIVDISHAVPPWERRIPGDFKPLARAALTGLVHGPVLSRRTKTAFTGVFDGLRHNAVAVRALLTASAPAQAGLIDPAAVLASLDRAVHGSPDDLGSLHALVAAEVWLTSRPVSCASWWEPVPVREGAR
ncbi:asparagine synthase-related protein [Kitasatospora sp. NPDC002227]|uniref:asparagine synthase-related protein n=1 Tax=Kitasatospora sp. NPDC002227 TaxID=3154773 RepID=UPI003316DFD9